jgi:signal transduction histidine kinase
MTELSASSVGGRWRPGARFLLRTVRRTLAESLYLLTAPVIAFAGLLLELGGLCVGPAGLLLRRRSPFVAGVLAPTRWLADLEWWRIGTVRSVSAGRDREGGNAAARLGQRPRSAELTASDPGLWLEVTHSVAVLPLAVVTSVLTAFWWFIGLGLSTAFLRMHETSASTLPPMTLKLGGAQSHIALSLGLTSPSERVLFGTVAGLLVLVTLPLLTRVCLAVQAGLGQALLSDTSALHRRIRGLEQERDTARAQTVAAVNAEATALRRLERDIHDGPQQRLVRLAMDLGRARHHFDTRPELAREVLAGAIAQTQEALDELRALSRGIAPPILADRGLIAAVTALAGRSTVPADLDVDPLGGPEGAPEGGRLDPGAETAAYFVVAEALTNVAKHSQAGQCTIGVRHGAGTLRVWVTDDGTGGAAFGKGHGLRGLDDRLRAAGGQLTISSPAGGPTTVSGELPCR